MNSEIQYREIIYDGNKYSIVDSVMSSPIAGQNILRTYYICVPVFGADMTTLSLDPVHDDYVFTGKVIDPFKLERLAPERPH